MYNDRAMERIRVIQKKIMHLTTIAEQFDKFREQTSKIFI